MASRGGLRSGPTIDFFPLSLQVRSENNQSSLEAHCWCQLLEKYKNTPSDSHWGRRQETLLSVFEQRGHKVKKNVWNIWVFHEEMHDSVTVCSVTFLKAQ